MASPAVAAPSVFAKIDAKSIPFALVHVVALVGILVQGWSWSGFALAIGCYYLRMFFVTGAHHRYFSHRAFKTSRWFQFVLAFMATTATQKGVLWWAAHHRRHHRESDKPMDVHSPRQRGFWWSHVGWVVSREFDQADMNSVRDLTRFPELVWIDKHMLLPPVAFAAACAALGGMHALLWGFFVSTVMLWHGTFTINSLSHIFGKRRYATSDDSKNNWLLALVTLGEGWHNNHHHYQSSAAQGFRWYELDVTYYVLKLLSLFGLVWEVRRPPAHVIAG